MAKLIKKVLSSFRSETDKNERKLVLHGETNFASIQVSFGYMQTIDETTIRTEVLKKTYNAKMTIINRGEIAITERFIIVNKSSMPATHEMKDGKEKRDVLVAKQKLKSWKTDLSFVVENKGNMRVVYNYYVVLDDTDAFIKSELLNVLADGITWESPAIIKKNTGTILKNVEIVAKLGDADTKLFDAGCSVASRPWTAFELGIIKKLNLESMDMTCLKNALCSIKQ